MTIDQTHGGWIPPHEPSASCRSRTHRSAAAIARRRRAPGRAAGADSPGRAPISRRSIARRPHGPKRPTTDSGDHRLPRPAGEVVDRERRRRRKQDQLRPGRRDPLPRPLAEQRHEALVKTRSSGSRPRGGCIPGSPRPASTPASFSATYASTVVERSARALEPVRPRAVVAAAGQAARSRAGGRSPASRRPSDVQPEEVLGDHRRVRLQLADPPAVGVLELEQPVVAALDGRVEAGQLLDALMQTPRFAAATAAARTRAPPSSPASPRRPRARAVRRSGRDGLAASSSAYASRARARTSRAARG